MRVRTKRYRTVVLWFVVVATSGLVGGCGELGEFYVVGQPIYPNGLACDELQQLQAIEIERQQFQYGEIIQKHLGANNGEQYIAQGIPLLTLRFGGRSSGSTLGRVQVINNLTGFPDMNVLARR